MGLIANIFRRSADPKQTGGAREPAKRWLGAPRWATVLVGLAVLAVLYWGLIGALIHDTSADLTLRPGSDALPPGGSVTAAYAATLIEQELDRGSWTPNDSILSPAAGLSEMPAFQSGVITVVAAAVEALSEAGLDEDVADAAEDLAVEPERGFFNGSFPFIGGSAGAHYRDASRALVVYNNSLATGEAVRMDDERTARLLVTAIDAALSPDIEEIDRGLRGESRSTPDDVLHARIRGEAYAAAMLMRGIRSDFDQVLRQRQLGSASLEAAEQLDRVATEQPLVIGTEDLTSQGYFLRSAQAALARMAGELIGGR